MGRIQTAQFDNLIRRLYSIKGGGSELSETLGDLFPILDLENLPSELLLLRGWHMFSGFTNVIGISAQLTMAQLFNPAASTSLVALDRVIINSQKAQIMTYGLNIALASPVINTVNMDTRSAPLFNANARIAADADLQSSGNAGRIEVVADTDYDLEFPGGICVLSPGGVFSIASAQNDSDLSITFIGRERNAEPSELSF